MQSLSKIKLQAEQFSHELKKHLSHKVNGHKNSKTHKHQVNTNFISTLGISLPGVYFF